MLALAILLFGLLVVLAISAVVLIYLGLIPLLAWVVPAIPGMVTVGTLLLALIEILLFFGGPEDRKTVKRDMAIFIPTIVISGLLAWASALFLWR